MVMADDRQYPYAKHKVAQTTHIRVWFFSPTDHPLRSQK